MDIFMHGEWRVTVTVYSWFMQLYLSRCGLQGIPAPPTCQVHQKFKANVKNLKIEKTIALGKHLPKVSFEVFILYLIFAHYSGIP